MEDNYPSRSFMNKPSGSNQRQGFGNNQFLPQNSNPQTSQIRQNPNSNQEYLMPQDMTDYPPGIGHQYPGQYYYQQGDEQTYVQPHAQSQFSQNQFERAKKPDDQHSYATSAFPTAQFERAKKPTHNEAFPQGQFERAKKLEDSPYAHPQFPHPQGHFEHTKKVGEQPSYSASSFPSNQFERAKKPISHEGFSQHQFERTQDLSERSKKPISNEGFSQHQFERVKDQSYIPQQYIIGQFEGSKKPEDQPFLTSFSTNQFERASKPPSSETFSQRLREKFGKASTSSETTSNLKPPHKNITEGSSSFGEHSTNASSNNYNDSYSAENYSNSGIAFQTHSFQPSFEKLSMKSEPPIIANPPKADIDDLREKKVSVNPTEDIMNAILKNQINCVSLLNEVGSKVKKRVDYIMKEVPMGKIKAFECTCVLDKQNIGFGRGNSKQAAKTDSANEGVRTLLTKEEFTFEKAHITLSVQKMTGVGTYSSPEPIPINPTPKPDPPLESGRAPLSQQDLDSDLNKGLVESSESALMNDSALYELNLIAKECFIEPKWVMSPPGGPNGEFEAQVVFDKLVAVGKGRKKLDAKRDAALKIIQQIRLSKELTEKYNPKAKKKLSPNASVLEIAKNDQRKVFFENCLDPRILQELQNESQAWREKIIKLQRSFGEYLYELSRQYALDEDTIDTLHEFFKRSSDYTDIVTSNPKQIMLDASKHLADYVTECSLVPIGSFALDCMRKDKLSINVLVTFQEIKKISEKEFLELYHYSLVECQKIVLREHSSVTMKMEFSIESSDIGNYLLITANTAAGNLTMQVQVSNLSQEIWSKDKSLTKRGDPSIIHIKRIYDCFEESERLNQFRNLMTLMRIWRVRNNLMLLSPELIDAVLLNEFLNNKAGVEAGYIINCLIVMSSEETFQAALAKCGTFYTKLYKDIPSKMKWTISSKCSQSLEAIYKEDFEESYFH